MIELPPSPPRPRNNWRKGLRVIAWTTAPILVAVVLAQIGPQVGPYLPPLLATSVNFLVKVSLLITVGGMLVLMTLILGATVTRWLFTIGFIWLFIVMTVSPYPLFGDTTVIFRKISFDIDPHYAVTEGLVISSPHRAAIEMDCARGSLQKHRQGDFHDHAALQPPEKYDGRYVVSVSANTSDGGRGRVVVVFRESRDRSAWPLDIAWTNAGDALVWDGICTPRGMDWHFSASLPKAYQQDEYHPRWWLP